jgi:RNA polymerase sigma factor (sigma-70 family)
MTPALGDLLVASRAPLLRLVESEGRNLLRHEQAEDLVQGIHLKALEGARNFEYRGDKEFRAWLSQVARRFLADRARHWKSLRREAGAMLRVSAGGSGTFGSGGAVDPSATGTGPRSFAARREEVVLAMRALTALFPRDQELIAWIADDLPLDEIARRLGIGYDAAKQARLRAIERFRKTAAAVQRGRH